MATGGWVVVLLAAGCLDDGAWQAGLGAASTASGVGPVLALVSAVAAARVARRRSPRPDASSAR